MNFIRSCAILSCNSLIKLQLRFPEVSIILSCEIILVLTNLREIYSSNELNDTFCNSSWFISIWFYLERYTLDPYVRTCFYFVIFQFNFLLCVNADRFPAKFSNNLLFKIKHRINLLRRSIVTLLFYHFFLFHWRRC